MANIKRQMRTGCNSKKKKWLKMIAEQQPQEQKPQIQVDIDIDLTVEVGP